ncbi:MAG: hypothetical protein JW864_07600 [Spirochaetes bacterium]|nr:hypothetical protein [Spirochaetota bacterium]
MIIKHTNRSGFMIFDRKFVLLFDCISGVEPEDIKDKVIVFFASCRNKDHYNEKLAKMLSRFHTTYIFSNDIKDFSLNRELTCILSPYQEVTLGPLYIRAFSNTDSGVAFYVKLFGKQYFHCGKLNWRHWPHMSPSQLIHKEADFKTEIDKIASYPVDFAFVTVDPRLKEHGYLAASYFADKVRPSFLIPMHASGHYEDSEYAHDYLTFETTKWIACSKTGQIIWETSS